MALAGTDVRGLFLAALERSPAERAGFLDEACAGDAALRQRVEALLRAHDEPGAFLGEGKPDPNHTAAYVSPSPLVGTIIAGRYKLLEEIGDGGMGTVWMAEQKEPVKRLVAVKLIKAGMDSKAVLARFEAERQALAMMDHPNIAKVHDAGTDDAGRPYFAMELVKGLPLTEYCDARKLSINDRLDLFVQICSAVQHAHQKAVIHRDLKPTNVLVTEHDGKPVPKVIDFGLAKALGATNLLTDRTLHTAYGTVVGTPLYMAPEQVGINALDVDTRTDIYALGVILYELLTGSTPLEKARFKETAWEEMKRLIREEEPPKPSTRLSSSASLPSLAASRQVDPLQLRRLIRGELDWIVMKALDKDRSRRYETANGLSRDVQRYLKGEAVEACPPTLGYRVRKLYRRNRAAALTAGLIGAVLLIATGVSLAFGIAATQAERRAREQEAAATDSAEKAKASEEVAQQRLNDLIRMDYVRSMQRADSAWRDHQFGETRRTLDGIRPDYRGWEWHYLNRLCQSDHQMELRAELANMGHAEFSPDDKWIMISSHIHTQGPMPASVQIVNANTGKEYHTLREWPNQSDAVFSHDSMQLIVVQPTHATIVDLAAKDERKAPCTTDSAFFSLAISRDGKRIAIGHHNPGKKDADADVLTVWDSELKNRICSVKNRLHCDVVSLSFSPDGRWVLGTMRNFNTPGYRTLLWDAATGAEVLEVPEQSAAPSHAAFSPKEAQFVVAYRDGNASVWNLQLEGKGPSLAGRPMTIRGHRPGRLTATFSPDGNRLVTASWDGTARVWDARSGAELRIIKGHAGMIRHACFSNKDGKRIITASSIGTVKVWDADASNDAVVFRQEGAILMYSASIGPNENWIMTRGPGTTKVWDIRTRKERFPSISAYYSIASPDGRSIMTIDWDAIGKASALTLVDAESGKKVRSLEGHSGFPSLSMFNSDGTRFLAANWDNRTLIVWDTKTGKKSQIGEPGKAGRFSFGISPDGKQVFMEEPGKSSETLDGITICDAETLQPNVKLQTTGFEYEAWAGTFSPDGKRFLAVISFRDSSRNECRVWDTASGRQLYSFPTHAARTVSIGCSPGDGKRIILACSDNVVKILDSETGFEVLTIQANEIVSSASFSPSGNKVIIVSGKEVRIYDGSPLPEPKK